MPLRDEDNAEVQPEPQVTPFEFDSWADEAGLSRKAVNILKTEALNSERALSLMTLGDIKSLNLQVGQAILLQAAVRTLQQPEPVAAVGLPPIPEAPVVLNATVAAAAIEPEDAEDVNVRASNVRLPDIRQQAEALALRGECLDDLLGHLPSSKKAVASTPQLAVPGLSATFDPRILLTVKAATTKAVHITQFLPERTRKRRAARRKQLLVSTEENAQTLVIQEDTEHPYAGINIEEWGGANARLMHHLLKTGLLVHSHVDFYLAYTAKIFDLADKYVWDSVMDYDHTYRELQAEHQFLWGTLSPHMELQILIPKRRSQLGMPTSTQATNSGQGQGPRSADCKLYKARGSCPFGQKCKYKHVRQPESRKSGESTTGSSEVSKNY